MPKDEKKDLKINKDNDSTTKLLPEAEDALDKQAEKVAKATLPEKKGFVEVEIDVDLTDEDGKPPIAIMFECNEERAIHTEWEYSDGTKGNYTFDVFPLTRDVVGRELKKSEGKGRSFSSAYCVPAKRILKCNAKKIYVIY